MRGFEKVTEWKERYGREALLLLGFILVGVLSFEAGVLKQGVRATEPLIVRIPESFPEARLVEKSELAGAPAESTKASVPAQEAASECSYVGSKNSNKYHLPTSRCAKQIKPANIVCFKNIEQAVARGYQPGCLEE